MKRINLLPPESRVKASRERGMIWAILILVVVVAALGLVYFKYHSDLNNKQDELALVEADLAREHERIRELSPYAELQAQRTAMTETAQGIYKAGVPFSILLQELSLVIPDNVRLDSLQAAVPGGMLPGAAADEGVAEGVADITLSGQTEDHRDVAEFMTRLGLMPQLTDIVLNSSDEQTAGATEGADGKTYVQFTITARLRPYTNAPPTTQLEEATR